MVLYIRSDPRNSCAAREKVPAITKQNTVYPGFATRRNYIEEYYFANTKCLPGVIRRKLMEYYYFFSLSLASSVTYASSYPQPPYRYEQGAMAHTGSKKSGIQTQDIA